jgi:hypothetical protein
MLIKLDQDIESTQFTKYFSSNNSNFNILLKV